MPNTFSYAESRFLKRIEQESKRGTICTEGGDPMGRKGRRVVSELI